jgi:hypothetical protein
MHTTQGNAIRAKSAKETKEYKKHKATMMTKIKALVRKHRQVSKSMTHEASKADRKGSKAPGSSPRKVHHKKKAHKVKSTSAATKK